MSTTDGPSTGVAGLPPMPDRHTGLPRPPRGPAPDWAGGGGGETDPRKRPKPPEGQAPVLEWFQETRSGSLTQGLLAASIFFGAGVFFQGGFSFVTDWVAWLLVLWPIPAFLWAGHLGVFAAGADWFSYKRTAWVRTYELTEAKLKVSSVRWELHLNDSAGRKVRVPWRPLLANRELWDLVYNGIRHSAATRHVETNREARKVLRLRYDG